MEENMGIWAKKKLLKKTGQLKKKIQR